MNVGTRRRKALELALENTRTDSKPRYMHFYNGVYWLETAPPTPGPLAGYAGSDYIVIFPSGVYRSYNPQKGPPKDEYADQGSDQGRGQAR